MDLYLYNTFYVVKGGVNLMFILKLPAKEVKIGFDNNNITITIKGIKIKVSLRYSLYAFNI